MSFKGDVAIVPPLAVIDFKALFQIFYYDEVVKFYKFLKAKKKYIMVAVKILNNEGFVITAYQTLKVQKGEW